METMENHHATIASVAITAYSALSACGIGNKTLYKSLIDNESQLAPLSLFNIPFPAYVGEIKQIHSDVLFQLNSHY